MELVGEPPVADRVPPDSDKPLPIVMALADPAVPLPPSSCPVADGIAAAEGAAHPPSARRKFVVPPAEVGTAPGEDPENDGRPIVPVVVIVPPVRGDDAVMEVTPFPLADRVPPLSESPVPTATAAAVPAVPDPPSNSPLAAGIVVAALMGDVVPFIVV